MTSPKKFEIAIIGAGITSMALANGLLKNPNVSTTVYEARSELPADGTGVGISGNGQIAMSLTTPQLRSSLNAAGAVPSQPAGRQMLANPKEKIWDMYNKHANDTVVRSRWVSEMAKSLPEGAVVTNKRLSGIEQLPVEDAARIRLRFEDGEEKVVDAVIGCDGINSFVRKYVLSPEHTSAIEAPWRPGFYTRMMIPTEEGVEIFGEEYCSEKIQTGWIGHNGFCMTDFEDEGKTMQVIAGFNHDKPVGDEYGKFFFPVPKDYWYKQLEGWGWIGDRISKVVEGQDEVWAGGARVHPPTPTYVKGKVCLAGDAARAFLPHRGAGASQGLEDAMVLTTVLESVQSQQEIEKAFRIYDELRRPRREMVAEYSSEGAEVTTGRSEAGTDPVKLREIMKIWNNKIHDYDLAALQQKCREMMQSP